MDPLTIILILALLAVGTLTFLAHVRISKLTEDAIGIDFKLSSSLNAIDDRLTQVEQIKAPEKTALDDDKREWQNMREWCMGIGERLNALEAVLNQSQWEIPTTTTETAGNSPTDETMTDDFRLQIETKLVLNAIHCQQSVRDWMHECDWNRFVKNRGVKQELARMMELIEKYPGGYWRDVYSTYTPPAWVQTLFKTDAPKDPDAGVKAIMTRLHNVYQRETGIDVQELKPFPTAYKA